MKTCGKCKVDKVKSGFSKDESRKDGLQPKCKECNRKYRQENSGRIAEYRSEYDQDNAVAIAEYKRAYAKENAAEIAVFQRQYRQINAIKLADLRRAYYEANKDSLAISMRAYRKAHPENCSANFRNRRARKRNADGTHTAADVQAIFDSQRGLCANCKTMLFRHGKQKFHVDHIQPLARGGSNDKRNLQCLCPTCNLRKSAKDPMKWANENGKLL